MADRGRSAADGAACRHHLRGGRELSARWAAAPAPPPLVVDRWRGNQCPCDAGLLQRLSRPAGRSLFVRRCLGKGTSTAPGREPDLSHPNRRVVQAPRRPPDLMCCAIPHVRTSKAHVRVGRRSHSTCRTQQQHIRSAERTYHCWAVAEMPRQNHRMRPEGELMNQSLVIPRQAVPITSTRILHVTRVALVIIPLALLAARARPSRSCWRSSWSLWRRPISHLTSSLCWRPSRSARMFTSPSR